MLLNKKDIVSIFSDVAMELGVPPKISGIAGARCFSSMVRSNYEFDCKEYNQQKNAGVLVKPLVSPEDGLINFLSSLSADEFTNIVVDNVSEFVNLYKKQLTADGISANSVVRSLGAVAAPPPERESITLENQQPAFEPIPAESNFLTSGDWSGKILNIENGIATQRINRAGDVVQHDVSKLSGPVQAGEVLDIQYVNGVGVVGVGGPDRGNGR